MNRAAAAALIVLVILQGCGGGNSVSPGPSPGPDPIPPPPGGPSVLVGAGDIGECGSTGPEATAKLLDQITGTVFTTGDNAYPDGSAQNFRDCYDPNWGRHKSRTRPSPGNHDYRTANGAPYYEYFGANAGDPGLGYYSYDLGAWHIVSLNSNVPIDAGSSQLFWLRQDLNASRASCTIAYWHQPLYSSGTYGYEPFVRDLWNVLYEYNVDIVLNGHDHRYERYGPMDPNGRADLARGIVEFVVGTGGGSLYPLRIPQPNLLRDFSTWGVLKLTLNASSYDWYFIPIAGKTDTDSGTATCH